MNTGKAWKFGDDIDTDQVLPSQYLVLPMEEVLGHVLETQSNQFAKNVQNGDFLIAGKNFGCGSSREQAPLALKMVGLRAIIAKSFARIFYRNAVNLGLLPIELAEIDEINDGDELSLDANLGMIKNNTSGKSYKFFPLDGLVKDIFDSGGLVEYLKKESV